MTTCAERAVENHVQHILIKLGLSNRSQLAVWVATKDERTSRRGRLWGGTPGQSPEHS